MKEHPISLWPANLLVGNYPLEGSEQPKLPVFSMEDFVEQAKEALTQEEQNRFHQKAMAYIEELVTHYTIVEQEDDLTFSITLNQESLMQDVVLLSIDSFKAEPSMYQALLQCLPEATRQRLQLQP